jgi:hypothetical protein
VLVERIDPATGAVVELSWPALPFATDASDKDLHPLTRELRIVNAGGENLRFSLDDEILLTDTPLDLPGDYVAIAHSPATDGAVDVSTWVIRSTEGDGYELARLGGPDGLPPAASGDVQLVGPLAFAGVPTGFDISPAGVAYLATLDYAGGDAAGRGFDGINRLYVVDLATAAASEVGVIGVPPGSLISGLAVAEGGASIVAVPVATPLELVVLAGAAGFAALVRLRRAGRSSRAR